jgi:CBS domain-containing protein
MDTTYRLRAGDLMTIEPIIVAVDATIEEAQRLILEYNVSGLPVIDEKGDLVGVISQTDFMHLQDPELASLIHHKGSGIRVGEVMSRPAVTVLVTTPLPEAGRKMLDERVHRLVVVDDDHRPVGVLSAIDFVQIVADD